MCAVCKISVGPRIFARQKARSWLYPARLGTLTLLPSPGESAAALAIPLEI